MNRTELQESIDRFSEVFVQVGHVLGECAVSAIDLLTKGVEYYVQGVVHTLLASKAWEEEKNRNRAESLHLVSPKVIRLSCRPGKTGNKNMSRIRKELKRYDKQIHTGQVYRPSGDHLGESGAQDTYGEGGHQPECGT